MTGSSSSYRRIADAGPRAKTASSSSLYSSEADPLGSEHYVSAPRLQGRSISNPTSSTDSLGRSSAEDQANERKALALYQAQLVRQNTAIKRAVTRRELNGSGPLPPPHPPIPRVPSRMDGSNRASGLSSSLGVRQRVGAGREGFSDAQHVLQSGRTLGGDSQPDLVGTRPGSRSGSRSGSGSDWGSGHGAGARGGGVVSTRVESTLKSDTSVVADNGIPAPSGGSGDIAGPYGRGRPGAGSNPSGGDKRSGLRPGRDSEADRPLVSPTREGGKRSRWGLGIGRVSEPHVVLSRMKVTVGTGPA